jgi:hypothetical protein
MTDLELRNVKKYLKAPTAEQVIEFVEEVGVSDLQFERFYEMSNETIKNVRRGYRQLPKKYWHFIYEKIVPTYGISYTKPIISSGSKVGSKKDNKQSVVDVNRLFTLK